MARGGCALRSIVCFWNGFARMLYRAVEWTVLKKEKKRVKGHFEGLLKEWMDICSWSPFFYLLLLLFYCLIITTIMQDF